MPIDATDQVANPPAASDPNPPAKTRGATGKSPSSRNATKNGLFAAHDFIREGEREEYALTLKSLLAQLSPEGVLEETFATEIMGANWRLRRCRMVEYHFGGRAINDPMPLDPMVDGLTEKEQKSVDRARAQSHHILRRSIAELRKLQTERATRVRLTTRQDDSGLADCRQVLNTLRIQRLEVRDSDTLATLQSLIDKIDQIDHMDQNSFCKPAEAAPPANTSFCKEPETAPVTGHPFCKTAAPKETAGRMIPRNSLCLCGSGTKYKRCCGKDAPPVLNMAA